MRAFSVCSRYMECSKQEVCIHPDEEMKNEKEDVIHKLKEKGITIENRARYNLCKNDFTSDSNKACCIVILTIRDKKYNIKNFNIRCITNDTAIQVRDYLREKGFSAEIQVNGAISVDYKAQNRNKKEKKASKKEKIQVKQEKKLKATGSDVLEGKISMFELLAI